MFSVIIPLYNKAPYVEKAIQSVLAQTFQEFELIVVDDGSKDNSLEKVQKFKNPKVQIIQQKNSGVSTARNNGVKAAKYDYIAFLDADDWWEPTFLEEMKACIEEFPEAAMYGCSYYIVKNGKNRIAPIALPENFEMGYIDYIKVYSERLCMPITSISVVIKKEVFNEMQGFKPQLKYSEDFDLWLRIALKYQVAFFNKPLAYYNQDVDALHRAVNGQLNPAEQDFIFNTDFLWETEQKNKNLKKLLDKQRVTFLHQYYFVSSRKADAKKELDKVDWSTQPLKYKLMYRKPYFLTKGNYLYKRFLLNLCQKFQK